MIGAVYKYPNHQQTFKLKAIEGFVYIFECGHRITDNVFKDLKLISSQTSLDL